MEETESVLFNEDATGIDTLLFNKNWYPIQLVEDLTNIYVLSVNGKIMNWIVKIYENKYFAEKEGEILERLNDIEGIPKLIRLFTSDKFNYAIIKKERGKDLFEHVSQTGPFSLSTTKKIAKKILCILKKIHERKVVHGDIKPDNIIYDPISKKVTIIDFGGGHTKDYQSPEQAISGWSSRHSKDVTEKTDIWSAGITIFVLLAGHVPVFRDREVVYPKTWDEITIDFFGSLIERDIILRYSAADALTHPWLGE